jgi:hypothetical protein
MFNIPDIQRKPSKLAYRKPDAVKHLEAMQYAAMRVKHPSMPLAAIPRPSFRDDGANGLTACIVAYITLKNGFASRCNNGGVYDKRIKRYRRTTSKRGLPDILATYNGKSLFVEVKTGRDRMSKYQAKVEEEQQAAGGVYYVAHNFTEFKQWFDNI